MSGDRIRVLEAENRRLSSIVRSIQQEVDFLRHAGDDPAADPVRAEGLRQWCGLIQACLDGAPPATGAGESDGGNHMGRDYRAKRLAAEQGIPYAEALRRTRAAQADLVRSPDRPAGTIGADVSAVYDWLEANGVREVLPPDPTITVAAGWLSFTAYVWKDWQETRWVADPVEQFDGEAKPITEVRTVPLMVPVPESVRSTARAAVNARRARFTLVERVVLDGTGDVDGD